MAGNFMGPIKKKLGMKGKTKPGEMISKWNSMKAGAGSGAGRLEKSKKAVKMTPVSKGHKPDGPHGKAAVKALGRTKTTGNFKKIEKANGKGAAIAAFQAKLKAHKSK